MVGPIKEYTGRVYEDFGLCRTYGNNVICFVMATFLLLDLNGKKMAFGMQIVKTDNFLVIRDKNSFPIIILPSFCNEEKDKGKRTFNICWDV